MSANVNAGKGGEFATSRRGSLDTYEIEFATRKAAEGVPLSAIAKMLARPVTTLAAIPGLPVALDRPTPGPPAPREPPPLPPTTWEPRSRVPRVRAFPSVAKEIARQVAIHHRLTLETIVGRRRFKGIAEARQEAYAALYYTGRYTLSMIGSWFGGRDHSTVLDGIKAHEARVAAVDEARRKRDLEAWKQLGERDAA